MKKTSIAMLIAAVTSAGVVQAETTEERISSLEKQAKRSAAKIKSLNKKADRKSDKMTVNGFFSTGVSATNKKEVNYNGVKNQENSKYDSIIGIQTTYKIDDKTDLTAQFVAKGDEGFNIVSDWAFLSHRLTNSLTLRAGRLRLPFYMYSENLEVGASYPWARPPCEVYCSTPLDAYEGMDMLYRFNTGNWQHTVQAYIGVGTSEDDDSYLDVNDSAGLNITTQYEDLTIRLGHAVGNVVATGKADSQFEQLTTALTGVGLSAVETPTAASFSGLGFKYDSGNLFLAGEYTNLAIEDNFFPDYESQFVSTGYRIGAVMPFVSYAEVKTQSEGDKIRQKYADTLNGGAALAEAGAALATSGGATDQAAKLTAQAEGLKGAAKGILASTRGHKTYSLGVRYDYSNRWSIKVQADRLFDMTELNKAGPGIDNGGEPTANVYSLVIDASF